MVAGWRVSDWAVVAGWRVADWAVVAGWRVADGCLKASVRMVSRVVVVLNLMSSPCLPRGYAIPTARGDGGGKVRSPRVASNRHLPWFLPSDAAQAGRRTQITTKGA
ncbi:hypothetical protein GCM10008901_12720 [Bifidobacterium pullorum]